MGKGFIFVLINKKTNIMKATTNKIQNKVTMKKIEHNLEVGSKLYWSDAPEMLAGIVVRFTNKRDVVINFVSGRKKGERNFPITLAKSFICK